MTEKVSLRRSLSLPLITFYGLGTIIGAGIYVLVGKVAGEAGHFTPLAFIVAAILAAFTAFSYAELVSRYPRSAGEAVYILHAFRRPWLAKLVGLLIITVGLVSTATLANGFVGYLDRFIVLPDYVGIAVLIVGLGALAAWGINQSVGFAALLTVVEIAGLVIVCWAARDSVALIPANIDMLWPGVDVLAWQGVLLAAFIAFYAFVGFEDMVNVAEEVKDASRTLPQAIMLALVITTLLYVVVAMTANIGLPRELLVNSEAPLADLYAHASGDRAVLISLIGLLSVMNGILVQIIMATRVLYGMSAQGWLHDWFARVHISTRTPLNATVFIVISVLALALWLPLVTLAKLTSFITMTVFTLISLSLWRVKVREPVFDGFKVPLWLPVTGVFASMSFLLYQVFNVIQQWLAG
ncbi:MAG: amino acid permease [Granulosicoccaceae bacterium]|jgi:amino acid transporter